MLLALTGLVVCGATALTTTAALTNQANINLGGAGIGSSHPFDLAVVGATGEPNAGKVVQANSEAGVSLPLTGGSSLVPGGAITSQAIVAFNNSPKTPAKLCAAVQSRPGVVTPANDLSGLLVFTVFDVSSGSPVPIGAANRPLGAAFDFGELKGRGSAPLREGEVYSPGVNGSEATFTIRVGYPDTTATESRSQGQASLRLKLTAYSDLTGGCS